MNTATRVGRLLAVSALAVAPALLALFLLGRYFGAGLPDFTAAADFDQYIYTREAATFAAVGFDGGYYGGDGHTARIGRFGPHGAAYAVVYGGLARLFGGWRDWLAPAVNMGLLTLALLACAPGMGLTAFAGLALGLTFFPPLVILLPTAYQDAPQCALGLVLALALAGLAGRGIGGAGEERTSRPRFWGTAGLVLAASLTRPTWAVLFPAVFFCATPGRWRDAARSLVLGGAAMALAYGLFSLTAAPWTASLGQEPATALGGGGPLAVAATLGRNLRSLADFTDNRYHALVLFLMLGGTGLALLVPAGSRLVRLRLAAVHLCNMAAPLLLYVALYNGSGRHLSRLLAAHFVLTLALCARTLPQGSRSLVLAPVLAGCLALFPATLGQYALFLRPSYDDYLGLGPRIAAQAQAMNPALRLSLKAASPWLRTLAMPAPDPAIVFLAAPAGYGVQLHGPGGFDAPLRAGFALLDPASFALAARATPLTALATTPQGTLYRNDAAFGFAPSPSGQETAP